MMSTTSRIKGDKFRRMAFKRISVCGMSCNSSESFALYSFFWIWSTIFSIYSKITEDAQAIACVSFHTPFDEKRELSINLKNLQIKPTLQKDVTCHQSKYLPFKKVMKKERERYFCCLRTSSRKHLWRQYRCSRMFQKPSSPFLI